MAAKTFGNNHATLIGLLVNWWVMGDPPKRWAVEAGPSFGYRPRGLGGGLCDALLGQGADVLGVVEVEGTRGRETAEKLGKFFAAEIEHFRTLKFGVLLVYAYAAIGVRKQKGYPPAADDATAQEVVRVSSTFPDKSLFLITLDKEYEPQTQGVRSRNAYYWGRPTRIVGRLYEGGEQRAELTLHESRANTPS